MIYPALKLYPKRHKGKGTHWTEYLALTEGAVRRLKLFEEWRKLKGYTKFDVARIMGCKSSTYGDFLSNEYVIGLGPYLSLMKFRYGNYYNKRDINYTYAYVVYPPSEIKRRIKRLKVYQREIGAIVGKSSNEIWAAANYGLDRTLNVYRILMFWLSDEEKKRGYDDALKFER